MISPRLEIRGGDAVIAEAPGAILLRESHHLRQRRQSSDQIHCIVGGIKEYTDLLDVQKMDNGIWQWKL